MKKTIIYFTGVYDTLDLFTDELRMAFEEMGYQSFVYDAMMQEMSKEALLALLFGKQEIPVENIDLSKRFSVVTFNNLGYNLALLDGTNIWEKCNIPYLNILMDHPFHYEKPLRNAPDTSIVLGTDRNHVAYIRRFFRNIRQADFLPHAGVELHCKHKPLAERGIDVLYAGDRKSVV